MTLPPVGIPAPRFKFRPPSHLLIRLPLLLPPPGACVHAIKRAPAHGLSDHVGSCIPPPRNTLSVGLRRGIRSSKTPPSPVRTVSR